MSLVNNILGLAKAGYASVNDEEIDIADLIREFLDERAREIRIKKVSISTSDDLGRITADRTQIYQLRDRVFLPFVAGDKGSTGNNGFGLSIVENIANSYNGYAKAYNDDGACFEVGLMDNK